MEKFQAKHGRTINYIVKIHCFSEVAREVAWIKKFIKDLGVVVSV